MEMVTGFRKGPKTMLRELDRDFEAYLSQLDELRRRHGDKWVIFRGGKFEGAFSTYDAAVRHGLAEFGDSDEFLLRQIEDRPVNIPMLFVRE